MESQQPRHQIIGCNNKPAQVTMSMTMTMTEHVVEAGRKEEVTVDVSGLPETPSVENEDPLLFSRAH